MTGTLATPSPETIAPKRPYSRASLSVPENTHAKSPLLAGFCRIVSGIVQNQEKSGGDESLKPKLSHYPPLKNYIKYTHPCLPRTCCVLCWDHLATDVGAAKCPANRGRCFT